jgi:hypothetical protein
MDTIITNNSISNINNSNSNINSNNFNDYINIFYDKINNYFIDNEIIINDNDDNYIKFKKYLVKYKRIIGVILLIILLSIGYCCDFDFSNNESNSYSNIDIDDNKNIQKGGAFNNSMVAAARARSALKRDRQAAFDEAAKLDKADADAAAATAAKAAKDAKSKLGFGSKSAAKIGLKKDKIIGKIKSIKTKDVKKGITTGATKMFDAGAAAAQGFKDNSDVIYQVFYSIAIFIVLCIVAIPSVALLGIGIICYFLLKDKMKTLKGL